MNTESKCSYRHLRDDLHEVLMQLEAIIFASDTAVSALPA